ncbi:MAG: adenylate/guanylate cyclase domain-containing protein [Gemmataceae bacterium]
MAELIAKWKNTDQECRFPLPASQPLTLGRSRKHSILVVPWEDRFIFPVHATLLWHGGKLTVQKPDSAKNPIVYQGEKVSECTITAGEFFIIGETTFVLEHRENRTELTFAAQELQDVPFTDVDNRIEALATLPGVIRFSQSEHELENRVLDVLLRGIPRASAAFVVRLEAEGTSSQPRVQVRAAKNKPGLLTQEPEPSRQLVTQAIRQRCGVIHLWPTGDHGDSGGDHPTQGGDFGWALCARLPDDPSPGWGLYVGGPSFLPSGRDRAATPEEILKSDLKFAELTAEIFGALRRLLHLQRQHTLLARFLPLPVLAAIAHKDIDEVLRPRQTEVTVLFCDLRGFSRAIENRQDDLPALCNRVSEALDIMASRIVEHEGVIGDFQGDAAMGFWGWPFDSDDRVSKAVRAAMAIQKRFANVTHLEGHALQGFTCGLGIATGPAIAGKLGSTEQFKISVFGHTVNLASRLESLTKHFRVPILIDERTAAPLRDQSISWARLRRVARVRPYGMNAPVMISEVLRPAVEPDTMSEECRLNYEAAFDAFHAGRWDDARRLLNQIFNDGPSERLLEFMKDNKHTPPPDWRSEGYIPMMSKQG